RGSGRRTAASRPVRQRPPLPGASARRVRGRRACARAYSPLMLPGMRAELTIEVARAPEDVFAYLTDVSNLPSWQSGVHSAQIEDAGPPRAGARIRESRHMLGRELNTTLEISEYDAPRLFCLTAL